MRGLRRFLAENPGPVLLAALALALVVVRGLTQSVVIDEADAYMGFAAGPRGAQWYPTSGNHLLQSLLSRWFSSMLGFGVPAMRLPAMLGAALYIASSLWLSALLMLRMLPRIGLLLCLVFNPMVLDYLVAARGYSLAVGCLLAALALLTDELLRHERGLDRRRQHRCALASLFLGLSFCANFAFAFACALTMLVFAALILRRRPRLPRASLIRFAAVCTGPGLVAAFLICGSVLRHWPKGQLYFGAASMSETWRSLVAASYGQLNPEIVNPLLASWLANIYVVLPYLLLALAISMLASALWRAARLPEVAVFYAAIIGSTALIHWLAFYAAHLLLPKDRTALFFIPLATLAFAALIRGERFKTLRVTALAMLYLSALFFAGSIRTGYFQEWRFDADSNHLFQLITELRRRGVTDFYIEWRYSAALNFYNQASGSGLAPFNGTVGGLAPGKGAYVVYYSDAADFIARNGLTVLYHNEDTGAAVAVVPR